MSAPRRFGTISPSRLFAAEAQRAWEEVVAAASRPVPADPAEAFAEAVKIAGRMEPMLRRSARMLDPFGVCDEDDNGDDGDDEG